MRARLRYLAPVLLATAAFAAPAAHAGLLDPVTQLVLPTCGTAAPYFAQFGDSSAYYAFPDNGFESGSTGWTLSRGASVVSGNEPWYVDGPGSHSLALSAGASATSPPFCINLLDPAGRMFAHAAGATGNLQVQVIFYGLTGNLLGVLNFATLKPGGYASWQPTSRFSSALALGTSYARIRLTSAASAGTWQVDDVFIDPYINRIG
jgi:hypothetical protein